VKTKFAAIGALCLALAPAALAQTENKTECQMTLPENLVWGEPKDIPPGAKGTVVEGDPSKAEYFTVRAKFPAGYKIAPHTHPAAERLTVLSGNLNMGMGEKFDKDATKPMPAGTYFSMPAGMAHFVYTTEETEIQLSAVGPWGITYINPEDDPRNNTKK
jgi:quercetin dioxygenase-like cupin family protein